MRLLEPGKSSRRRQRTFTRGLWVVASGLAALLIAGALFRLF